jgi:short-subunit dehydrogenase
MSTHDTTFFQGKSVLITGASSGIGEELAWQLGRAGAGLTLMARRGDVLNLLAERIASSATTPLVFVGDVTRDEDVRRAVAAAVSRWGKLDIAIANAGFGVVGPLKELTVDDYRRQFDTNVFGVLRTIYAALPELHKTRGNLVIMGSVAGWVASAGASAYAMSKFALRALATSLTYELRQSGIAVTLISPGFVDSDIRRVDNQGSLHKDAKDPVPRWLVVRTDKAVEQMLDAIAQGKREAIITGHGKLLVVLERFAPWVIRAFGTIVGGRIRGYRSG